MDFLFAVVDQVSLRSHTYPCHGNLYLTGRDWSLLHQKECAMMLQC